LPVILASVSAVGISIGAISAEPPRARRNDASAGWDSARANRHRKDRTATEPSSKVGEASQPGSASTRAVADLPPACKGVLDASAKQVHQSNVN